MTYKPSLGTLIRYCSDDMSRSMTEFRFSVRSEGNIDTQQRTATKLIESTVDWMNHSNNNNNHSLHTAASSTGDTRATFSVMIELLKCIPFLLQRSSVPSTPRNALTFDETVISRDDLQAQNTPHIAREIHTQTHTSGDWDS